MSVIAWDGKILAADKQATYGSLKRTSTKIYQLKSDLVIAFCGEVGTSFVLKAWYESGADKDKYPYELQQTDSWTQIIIVTPTHARFTDRQPYFQIVEDPFMAWGRGADFAIGAMEMGASAIEAVKITCKWCKGCGMGIDWYELK